MTSLPIRIVALYRFTRFDDCAGIRDRLYGLCAASDVRGTLLIASEGINGTIAGSAAAIALVMAEIAALPGCSGLTVKDSWVAVTPFHRLKVKVKREIVTMGQPAIDAISDAGRYVAPADWNALISAPDTIIIDTRNDYEVRVGSFAGAINPETSAFSDFPAWFRGRRDALLAGPTPPRVAMFCTGGIRCEKATAFLKSEGVENVFHLEGGILKYLETVPAAQSLWQGECFVFDQRVAVTQGLSPGTHSLCHGCRMPVSAADRQSALYVEGISCPACQATRSDSQRAGYAERHRQEVLAAARGIVHVGARLVQPV